MPNADYAGLALFFLIVLVTEIMGTLAGFGSSVFFVPLGQFFFDMQVVLGMTGVLHVFSNISKIVLFRKTIDWRLVLGIGISSVVLCIVGAFMTTKIDLTYAKLTLGLFLISLSAFLLARPRFALSPALGVQVAGGGIAGFLAGFIGTGGAVRGLVLASFNLEKNLFVGTSAAIDLGVDLSRSIIYIESDYLTRSMLVYVPLLIVSSFLGSYAGRSLLTKVSQATFKKIMLWLVLGMGVALVTASIPL